MKISNLKTAFWQNKQRGRVALLLLICSLWVAAVSVAQVGSPSRVTGLQLGDTPEGSRVSIIANSSLGDYEAFRRGDRFYVKIPMADLATTVPTFRASGFDDMQVQKQGSSVVISFKLQPGASARVDERANRLDVIFSSPNRTANRGAIGSQVARDRGPDAAGPMPPVSTASSRTGFVVADNPSFREPELPSAVLRKHPKGAPDKSSNATGATAQATPNSSPSSILSPGNSTAYAPIGSSTPPASASSAKNSGGSNGGMDWKGRFATLKHWMAANQLATLLGALILLSLLAYLILAYRARKQNGYKAKSAKTPKVQPKYSPGEELREVPETRPVVEATAPQKPVAQSAAAGSSVGAGNILTRPTVVETPASQPEQAIEQEDREVFEL